MSTVRLLLALASLVLPIAGAARAAIFPVTTVADAGAGSLRQAITDANASGGADRIEFAIPAGSCSPAGVCTIALASPLPELAEAVEIDGTSQTRHGTAPVDVCPGEGTPSFMRVELIGPPTSDTLESVLAVTSAAPSAIRGLAIGGQGVPVRLASPGAHRVQCNHLGANGAGDGVLELGFAVLLIDGAAAGAIVGTDGDGSDDLAERNLFAPVATYGIYVNANHDNRISGNTFGLASDGLSTLPCSVGIQIRQSSSRNLVGSDEDGVSDALEGNTFEGCSVAIQLPIYDFAADNRVVRNRFDDAGTGIVIDKGTGTVLRNNVLGGCGVAVRLTTQALLSPLSRGNCLADNGVGVQHEGSEAVVFEGNWWGAADGPGGDGPGSGDPIDVTGSGSLDVVPFQTAGCVFVPEATAGWAGLTSAAGLALLGARRRCAASSSA